MDGLAKPQAAWPQGLPSSVLDDAARAVLSRYPAVLRPGSLTPLGNHGGFSGSRLWRVTGAGGALCLRAWPAQEEGARLAWRHRLMAWARQEGLTFVPAVLAAGPTTWVEYAGLLWELTEWLPGRADFHECPSRARLEEACRALARLHAVWERLGEPGRGPCPALRRRLACLEEWHRLLRSGWRPPLGGADPSRPLVERACRVLARRVDQVPGRLQPWAGAAWRLQPCLCDLWHDHLLFEGDRLTGLVDYGAVKTDGVAVDLARLLGSLVEDDAEGWRVGLGSYREVRGLSREEEELARALDQTGAVLGVVNWLRWLYGGERAFEDRRAAERRLGELVERIERWDAV
jgi:homoserine kinase type II